MGIEYSIVLGTGIEKPKFLLDEFLVYSESKEISEIDCIRKDRCNGTCGKCFNDMNNCIECPNPES